MSDKLIPIEKTCIVCKVTHTLYVPETGFNKWLEGESIQRALPELSDDDKEILLSSICGNCFDSIM
jgi:hypothetical protein